jgi:hypothetical protein
MAPDSGAPARAAAEPQRFDLAQHPRALLARVRAELHALLRDLAAGELESAARRLREGPDEAWDSARLEAALAPFLAEYGEIDFTPRARQAQLTHLEEVGHRRWRVEQVLCDPQREDLWALHGEIDLGDQRDPEGPLFALHRIGA